MADFDLVILGGGSGGYAAALRASQLGQKVVLIEKDKLGGTCLHKGCIPTKALLHAGEIADNTRHAGEFGVKADFHAMDMSAVNSYKDGVIAKLHKGLEGLVKSRNVTYVQAAGKLISNNTVEAGGTKYTGKNVILATGSYPKTLPGLEIDGKQIITSEQAIKLDYVPKSVIVLGVKFKSATKNKKDVKVVLEDGKEFSAEILLVAVGRGPVSQGLGYEEAGIKLDRGYVLVDNKCRTNVAGIWAVGDLIPTPQLAHVGFAEGIMVAEEIAGLNPRSINYDGIPRVTYSEPEVASVGLSAIAAKAAGHDVVELNYDLAGNGKANILKTAGSVKLIAKKNGPVLGIHMVGSRVGELLAEAQLIFNWEADANDVAQHIHAHPTLSEAMGEAHLALAGKPLHAHG